jgi:alpha-L-arabinofuranosidase
MKRIVKAAFLTIGAFLFYGTFAQQSISITVDAGKPYAEIQPNMWGVFFEDINFGADGGIYAELVKNRSFEFYRPLMGWKEGRKEEGNGSVLVINRGEENPNNPRIARVTVNADSNAFSITNEGFRGMGVWKDKQYNFSILAKNFGEGNVSLKIQLLDNKGEIIGEAGVPGFSAEWKKYTASLQCTATDAKAKLKLVFTGKGDVDIDMVSLFPQDTWKQRPNGFRADLVQMLADLKPGFVRFPGGCIVEGFDLSNRYQWKNTIGNVEDRKLIINRWNTEFSWRQAPDYFQSYGLGFYEYFLLSEDLGAEPLPIINCGMACQYNSAEVAPMNQLDPYIQDALDLIEFANGPADSKWGKIRAEMGHPAPFNLKLLGIGNEQWDEQYVERFKVFEKAIKQKYPSVKLITSSGPSPDGPRFDYLWGELKKLNVDFVDEHYYQKPEWFLKNANRYDNYDRKGPKVFAGEYASHSKEDKAAESRNNWESALTEAAFMTGLERNADVVHMASYAPLFAHVEAWQWRPDLIWFDNLRVMGTPNYYVQKLFSNFKGTNVVKALREGEVIQGKDSIYSSAVIDRKTNEVIIKIVNASTKPLKMNIEIKGTKADNKPVEFYTMSSADLMEYNSLDQPDNLKPVLDKLPPIKGVFAVNVKERSVNVLKIPCSKLAM